MAELTIRIEAPELAHAILELASILAMGVGAQVTKYELQAKTLEAPKHEAQVNVTVTQPVGTPVAAPVVPMAAQTPVAATVGVPTTVQSYTMDQLAVAATQLVDAGRRGELVGLLQSYGVQALTGLPKDQYGAFATALRGMGARL